MIYKNKIIYFLIAFIFCSLFTVSQVSAEDDLNLSFVKEGQVDIVLTTNDSNVNMDTYINDLQNELRILGLGRDKVNIKGVEGYKSNKALILQEDEAWASGQIVRNTLVGLGYQPVVKGAYDLPNIDLYEYSHIFITSDQTALFYSNLDRYMYKITDWVKGGGILQFNAADQGWRATSWTVGPGNLTHVSTFDPTNYMVDRSTIVTRGIPDVATGNYASHGYFLSYPANSKIFATDTSGRPTILEFNYGKGTIFAQTTTAEYYTNNVGNLSPLLTNTIEYNITKVLTRSFIDILREPTWRENSQRYLLSINSTNLDELNDSVAKGEIVSRLMSENISYVSLGNSSNKNQMDNFIRQNGGKGYFTDKTNHAQAVRNVANYIYEQYQKAVVTDGKFVLVGEDINITVNPSNLKTNTATAEYPDGRWKIEQDYNYFENSLGQASWVGKWQKDLVMIFDKSGQYEIAFADKHPTPRFIYAHRKPVASFKAVLNASKNGVTYTDNSYDMDLLSQSDKGISQYEWQWKKVDDISWNNGQVTSGLSPNTDYLIKLRVKDYQDTWSDESVKYITNKAVSIKPIADFTIPASASRYLPLDLQDNSYDPSGGVIASRTWSILKDGNTIYNGSTPILNFMSYGVGTYQYKLVVKNANGLQSEEFSRFITITDDLEVPEATVIPNVSDWVNNSINVKAVFTDEGGSLFKNQRYAITTTKGFPVSQSLFSAYSTSNIREVTLNDSGTYYIHFEASDNAGNIMKRTSGPYQIDKINPSNPSINLSSTEWSVPGTVYFDINNIQDNNGGSGVDVVQYKIEGHGGWKDYNVGSRVTLGPDVLGKVKILAKVIDKVGNVSDEVSVFAYLDSTPPEIESVIIDKTTLKVVAVDRESGLHTNGAYKYYQKIIGKDSDYSVLNNGWVKDSAQELPINLSNTKYLYKVDVRDNSDKVSTSNEVAYVSAPVIPFAGIKEGDFDNTVTIDFSNSIGSEVKVKVFREGAYVALIENGNVFKDEGLDYERDYNYKFIATTVHNGREIESLPTDVKVSIGKPTLEVSLDSKQYYRTTFTKNFNVTGDVIYRKGGTVLLSLYRDGIEISNTSVVVSPYVKTKWSLKGFQDDKENVEYVIKADLKGFENTGLYKKEFKVNVKQKDPVIKSK